MNAKQRKNWEEAKLKGLAALDKAAADFRKSKAAGCLFRIPRKW